MGGNIKKSMGALNWTDKESVKISMGYYKHLILLILGGNIKESMGALNWTDKESVKISIGYYKHLILLIWLWKLASIYI